MVYTPGKVCYTLYKYEHAYRVYIARVRYCTCRIYYTLTVRVTRVLTLREQRN